LVRPWWGGRGVAGSNKKYPMKIRLLDGGKNWRGKMERKPKLFSTRKEGPIQKVKDAARSGTVFLGKVKNCSTEGGGD